MNKKLKEFTEAYRSASKETKEFINSDAIGLFSEQILNNTSYYGIKQKIIVILANRFLAITTNEEVLSELLANGISADTVIEIMPKIKEFINQSLKNTPSPQSTLTESIPDEIAETEARIKSLNTIRTMTGDQQSNSSQNETTYPSVQDDILKQKNNPTPPSSPRWESGS